MTVTVRNLTKAPLVLTVPPEVGGWQRQRVAVRIRGTKGPRHKRPSKAGVAVHDRRFPHSLTLMAKGTEGSEVRGLHDALKNAPDFVAAQARRAIAIVDETVADEVTEKKAEAPTPVHVEAVHAEGSTDR